MVSRAVVAAWLTLIAVQPMRAQNPALGREQVAAIEKDVIAAIHNYYRLYSEKDNKAIGPDVFFEPWFQLNDNGPIVARTGPPAEIEKQFKANVERLTSQGWAKSEFPKPTVCVVNPSTALASGEFRVSERRHSLCCGRRPKFGRRNPEGIAI